MKGLGFASVVGVDPRFKKAYIKGQIKTGPDFSELNGCDIVIVLTSEGRNIIDAVHHLKRGVTIIDDTHPPIPEFLMNHLEKEKKADIYRVGVSLSGVKIFPRFPNYAEKWIPGCAVEAIVASNGDVTWANQEEFARVARDMGFTVRLRGGR